MDDLDALYTSKGGNTYFINNMNEACNESLIETGSDGRSKELLHYRYCTSIF